MNKFNKTVPCIACVLILLSGSAMAKKKKCKDFWRSKCNKTVRTVVKVAEKAGKTVGEAPGNVIREGERGAKNVANEVGGVHDNVVRATGDALNDTVKTIGIAHSDVATAIRRAGDDTEAEIGRAGKNLEDAEVAIREYIERKAEGTIETLTDAERRVREGKVVDALFHLAIDPLRKEEKNMALATQESKLVDAVGRTAASVYGGPQGAAAYAAWSTYRRTGDADLAMRVGVITGLANKGFDLAGEMPIGNEWEIAKKAAIAGSIGGLAVAASGGDEAAVRDGFLMAGGMVLVRDGYKKYTGHNLDPKGAEGPPYCMKGNPLNDPDCPPPLKALKLNEDGSVFYDDKGNPVVDFSKLNPKRPLVGEWSKSGEDNWKLDNSKFMTSVARVPGMNAMALFHDKWAVSWKLEGLANYASIVPAVVLTYTGTYVGTGAAINAQIQDVNIKTAQDEQPDVTAASARDGEPTSFLCMKDNLSRSIFIAIANDEKDLACVVIYQKDKESKEDFAPWYALKDKDYCKIPATKLAQDHIAWGWSCFAR
jgi:hypothetical protein